MVNMKYDAKRIIIVISGIFAFLIVFHVPGCSIFQDPVDAQYSAVSEPTLSSFPSYINGMWLIDGQVWYMTMSSIAYCEDGRSIDFPTYKVCWSVKQEKFYYVRKRTLYSYDPISAQTIKLCKLDRDAHFIKAVTDNYAIVAEEQGTRVFQVNLNTFEIQEITVSFEFPLCSYNDRIVYYSYNGLYEYSCEQTKSVLLYEVDHAESRLVSACYRDEDILFVRRWGDFKKHGALYCYDRETNDVMTVELSYDVAAVCWMEDALLCVGSVWNSENYGNLYLYKVLPDSDSVEILLDENLPYTALVDVCNIVTDGQRFALSCRGDIIIDTLE